MANEFGFMGIGGGSYEYEVGRTVGRSDNDPGAGGPGPAVKNELEAQPVDVEVDAAFQVPDIDGGRLQAEIWVSAVQANGGVIEGFARWGRHTDTLYEWRKRR
jgi:hypothetical protein